LHLLVEDKNLNIRYS